MGKSLEGKYIGKNISQRKDGLYQASYMDENGKRKYMYGRNLRKLKQDLKHKQQEIDSIKLDDDMILKTGFNYMPTVKEIWEQFVENRLYNIGLKDSTIRNYLIGYNVTIKDDNRIENVRINQFTRAYCEKLLRIVQEEHGTLVKQFKNIMSALFKYAIDCELIEKNPMYGLSCINRSKEKEILTLEEQKILINTEWNRTYRNFIIVALQSGLRCGELCGLTWDDIDFEKEIINVDKQIQYFKNPYSNKFEFYIVPPKTHKSIRKVPLTESAANALKDQYELSNKQKAKEDRFDNFVFKSQRGYPLNTVPVDVHLKKLLKKSGINHDTLTSHMFRHTFASYLSENHVNMKDIQSVLGHEKIDITMNIYAHSMKDEKTLVKEIKGALPNIKKDD